MFTKDNKREKADMLSFKHTPLNLSWFCQSAMSCWFVVHCVSLPVCCLLLWPWAMLWLWAWCHTGYFNWTSEFRSSHESYSGQVSGCSLYAVTQPCNPGIFSRLWLHMGKGISTKTHTHTALWWCFCKCSREECIVGTADTAIMMQGRNISSKGPFPVI